MLSLLGALRKEPLALHMRDATVQLVVSYACTVWSWHNIPSVCMCLSTRARALLQDDPKVLAKLHERGQRVVSEREAQQVAAEIGATFVMCSALTQQGLKNVFDTAIRAVLRPRQMRVQASKTEGKFSLRRLPFFRSFLKN